MAAVESDDEVLIYMDLDGELQGIAASALEEQNLKKMEEKKEDELWATEPARRYALLLLFKHWHANDMSFYKDMPTVIHQLVIKEALTCPMFGSLSSINCSACSRMFGT